jgi:hypothetical protein
MIWASGNTTITTSTCPISSANGYIKSTYVTSSGYSAVIFDYSGNASTWSGGTNPNPTPGQCNITFNSGTTINYLIIGGGGGAGQGTYNMSDDYSAGVGGGGASIIYDNTYTLPITAGTVINIQVGYAGGGNTNPYGGAGQSTGGISGTSYIKSTTDISFNAFGGKPGGGIGVVYNITTGDGGSSYYYLSGNTNTLNFGGGGGGGGGALASSNYSGGPNNGGIAGYYNYYYNLGFPLNYGGTGGVYYYPTILGVTGGNTGASGNSSTIIGPQGKGDGGNSYYVKTYGTNYITVPFKDISSNDLTSYVYCGNAAGGGTNTNGGSAGATGGGLGGGNSISDGKSALSGYTVAGNTGFFYYGSGGGGGAPGSTGGNGANGAVMLWWPKISFNVYNSNGSINLNYLTNPDYGVAIFDYNGNSSTNGFCNITFRDTTFLNFLIIGGGGDGGSGYTIPGFSNAAGQGGGGGGIIYRNYPLLIPPQTTFNIQVGYPSQKSYISSRYQNISFISNGGGGGGTYGLNSLNGYGGDSNY